MPHLPATGTLRRFHCLVALLQLLSPSAHAQQTTTYRYQYDPNGNLTQSTDPLGHITRHSYDALNRRIATTDPAGGITSFTYDARDHLTSVTDPRGLVTTYTYDGFGNLTATTSPDSGTTTYTHDAVGNVTSRTDARGLTTAYAYDALSRLIKVTHADGSTVTYTYDQGTYAIGRLSGMTDASGQTSYSYDARGRITSTVHTIGSGTAARSYTVSRTYGSSGSSTGKPVQLTYPSGNRIEITYAVGGRLASLTLYAATDSATAIPLLTDIAYAPFGPATGWKWGNNAEVAYRRSSDLDGRTTSYPIGDGAAGGSMRALGYDDASRLIAVTDSASAAAGASYGYDSLDRLTSAITGSSSQSYRYDANGNRTRFDLDGASHANTIAAGSNRLTQTTGPAPAKSNRYDAAGNLVSDGSISYTYSASGRMQSATIGANTATYLYDGKGQRVRKSGPTTLIATREVDYVYDADGKLLGEYDATGKPLQETVYLGNVPVAVIKPVSTGIGTRKTQTMTTAVYYVYADQIDTPRMITRASDNKIVWRWDSADPFGMMPPNENPGGLGTFVYDLRFPGQVYDKETNLHYNYYRDYDRQTGRYVQSDPIGLAGGINTYIYALNQPVMLTDPLGLFTGKKHNEITSAAIAITGISCSDLPRDVAMADWSPGSQDPQNAHWHAMRDGTNPNETPGTAQKKYEDYVDRNIKSCTCAGLARALHAVQDSYAVGHRGNQPWGGGLPSLEHVKGDRFPSAAEQSKAVNASVEIIKRFQRECKQCPTP